MVAEFLRHACGAALRAKRQDRLCDRCVYRFRTGMPGGLKIRGEERFAQGRTDAMDHDHFPSAADQRTEHHQLPGPDPTTTREKHQCWYLHISTRVPR
jgi:hypothetical protein